MSQTSTTRIDILRHGLPEGDGCLRGHTDFPITGAGLKQMAAAVDGLADVEQVLSSPLKRCCDFAVQFADQHALPIEQLDVWKEMNFGHWDGESRDQLWQSHGEVLTQYWQDPWQSTPHGGETLQAFDARIQGAWQLLLKQHRGKRLLLVTHAGVMKQLLRILLEMPENALYLQRLDLPYAARYRVTVFHDQDGQSWPQIQWPTQQQYESW
ncbi:histidine phosphatase family protein [Photobacterium sp. TY1-4]|uniref:histidine phosphatase family protein n=1 Tax=Photobacterium sp. TY1-4 TaxID=2899122 RepID=UPI0021C07AEC|nr:histidine phosphatase family protein [Photobacterium sp. TY1-4]UXI04172.1 histidine phosphatase family protein [Photobacterium sp. TY1-4]